MINKANITYWRNRLVFVVGAAVIVVAVIFALPSAPDSSNVRSLRVTIVNDTQKYNVVSAGFSRLGQFVMGTPMQVDSTLQREHEKPWIAESIEPEPGHPENWLIMVRNDAKFSNYELVTTADVMESIRAAADENLDSVLAGAFTAGTYIGAEVIAPRSVRVRFKSPWARV